MQSHNDQLSGALMRYQVCNFYISCHSLNSNGTFVLHDGRWNLKSLWLDRQTIGLAQIQMGTLLPCCREIIF